MLFGLTNIVTYSHSRCAVRGGSDEGAFATTVLTYAGFSLRVLSTSTEVWLLSFWLGPLPRFIYSSSSWLRGLVVWLGTSFRFQARWPPVLGLVPADPTAVTGLPGTRDRGCCGLLHLLQGLPYKCSKEWYSPADHPLHKAMPCIWPDIPPNPTCTWKSISEGPALYFGCSSPPLSKFFCSEDSLSPLQQLPSKIL